MIYSVLMPDGGDVTRTLDAAARGDPHAAQRLLPLVYDELRKLAAQRMAREAPGQTLQATALVHDAYLRLVDVDHPQHWKGRGHFFAAAAEAMRRILVERARRVQRARHGGGRGRVDLDQLDPTQLVLSSPASRGVVDMLALDEALARLEAEEPAAAAVVKLRYFAGLTIKEAADALGIAVRTANRHWAFAKSSLYEALNHPSDGSRPE
jgi:RNA polymerase sigma factor (TIGR02999 family)